MQPFMLFSTMNQHSFESDAIYHHSYNAHHSNFSTFALQDRFPRAQDKPLFYVGVYACIGLANVILNIASMATNYSGALRGSRILFHRLLVTVVRATMRWHDVTPAGRLLNRFSRDIETIDSSLSSSLQTVNSAASGFLASVVIIVVVFPPFLVPATVVGYFYF